MKGRKSTPCTAAEIAVLLDEVEQRMANMEDSIEFARAFTRRYWVARAIQVVETTGGVDLSVLTHIADRLRKLRDEEEGPGAGTATD